MGDPPPKRGKVMAYTQGKPPKNRKEHTHTKIMQAEGEKKKKSRSHSVAGTKSTQAGRISTLGYQSLLLRLLLLEAENQTRHP